MVIPNSTLPSSSDTALLQQKDPQALGKQEFLKLLITQLKNQDPLSPQEGSAFIAELAQFSSVEQLTNINTTLGNYASQIDALKALIMEQGAGTGTQGSQLGTAANLIGRVVEFSGNHATWNGSEAITFGYELGEAAQARMLVRDSDGNLVRDIDLGGLDADHHSFTWDGLNDHGETLPAGTYTFEVVATGAGGETLHVPTYMRGYVDRINFGQDGFQLRIGGRTISMSDVRSLFADDQV
jgi:flagellar basal-body rod modification protein FlgD